MNTFWNEFEKNTSSCENGKHRKYGEVILRCKMLEPKVLKIAKIISFNPRETIKTCKFICNLCDQYDIKIIAHAVPCIVGPSITKDNTFFIGLDQERLLRFYRYWGFETQESEGNFIIIREPKK
jgi:hypothetical protein